MGWQLILTAVTARGWWLTLTAVTGRAWPLALTAVTGRGWRLAVMEFCPMPEYSLKTLYCYFHVGHPIVMTIHNVMITSVTANALFV